MIISYNNMTITITATTIAVLALAISILVFVKSYLLDKEYGEIVVTNHHTSNVINNNPKNGFNFTIMSFDLSVIKSPIYKVSFDGFDKSDIITIGKYKNTISENSTFTITIKDDKKRVVKVNYEDKFGNKYLQSIGILPSKLHNGIPYGWVASISKRRIRWLNQLDKFYR